MSHPRIAFVSGDNVYATPYLDFYEECFEGEYDLIHWNRAGGNQTRRRARVISYRRKSTGVVSKLLGYVRFIRFAGRALKRGDYDRVVFLQAQWAILMLAYWRYYKNAYLCDIRDFSFERIRLFRFLQRRVVKKARLNLISSPGFRDFLPAGGEYRLVHNGHQGLYRTAPSAKRAAPLTITFIGSIRFYDQCKRFVDAFGRDERFRLKFVGGGANGLKEYCASSYLGNCEFIDRFPPEETLDHLRDCDLIFNVYGNRTPLLDYALSNKLYYSAELGIPILVSPDTYMARMSDEYQLGFPVELSDPKAPDVLWQAYEADFDFGEFDRLRREFLLQVERDNELAAASVTGFLAPPDPTGCSGSAG